MYKSLMLVLSLATAGSLPAQQLVCPTVSAATGKPCDVFHYHVQAYDPETRGFGTFTGINQFASLASCERAREILATRNASVVDFVKRVKTKPYEADRIGPCHCDMTGQASGGVLLTDEQRAAQKRAAEEIRRRVRDRLASLDAPVDSNLVPGITVFAPIHAMLGGERLVAVPQPRAVPVARALEDLRMTQGSQGTTPVAATIDLPLAAITGGAPSDALEGEVATAVVPEPPVAAPASAETVESTSSGDQVMQGEILFPESAGGALDTQDPEQAFIAVDDAAESFIGYETQRIQNVLAASIDVGDETGAKILEACMHRTQLLTNVRMLIQGSGARSRIALAARLARKEADRIRFVQKLFGDDIAPHWAPKYNVDVIVASRPEIESNPERVLRDSSGEFTGQQKRYALYRLLGGAPITEEQQLWLIPLIDGFLQ